MCSFRPGDEVVCVRTGRSEKDPTVVGSTYTVSGIFRNPFDGVVALELLDIENGGVGFGFWGHDHRRFRKVERKNDSLSIEAFLTIKPGFEEPKRTPAKKRERV